MHCFFALGIVSIQWAVIGYSLAFGHTHGGLIGGLEFAFMRGVGVGGQGRVDGDSARAVHDLPVHVRGDHAGAHRRRVRRAHEVLRLLRVHAPVGDAGLRSARALGVLTRRLARQARRARLCRLVRWCICRRGSPRSCVAIVLGKRLRLSVAQARAAQRDDDGDRRRTLVVSAGSASTPDRRSARTGWRRWRSPTRTWRRRRARSPGGSSKACASRR